MAIKDWAPDLTASHVSAIDGLISAEGRRIVRMPRSASPGASSSSSGYKERHPASPVASDEEKVTMSDLPPLTDVNDLSWALRMPGRSSGGTVATTPRS
jgi:hypothetical protein